MTTENMLTTAREFRTIKAMIEELEAEAEALKQQMIRELDNRKIEELKVGDYTIRHSLYQSSRLDTTALKRELPDIAAQYTKLTTSTRFQVA